MNSEGRSVEAKEQLLDKVQGNWDNNGINIYKDTVDPSIPLNNAASPSAASHVASVGPPKSRQQPHTHTHTHTHTHLQPPNKKHFVDVESIGEAGVSSIGGSVSSGNGSSGNLGVDAAGGGDGGGGAAAAASGGVGRGVSNKKQKINKTFPHIKAHTKNAHTDAHTHTRNTIGSLPYGNTHTHTRTHAHTHPRTMASSIKKLAGGDNPSHWETYVQYRKSGVCITPDANSGVIGGGNTICVPVEDNLYENDPITTHICAYITHDSWKLKIFLLIIGIFMIAIGCLVYFESQSSHFICEKYTENTEEIKLHLTSSLESPVFVFYRLDNFYQSTKRLVKGKPREIFGPEYSCNLVRFKKDVFYRTDIQSLEEWPDASPLLPCGASAASIFNDDFSLKKILKDKSLQAISIDSKDIMYSSDKVIMEIALKEKKNLQDKEQKESISDSEEEAFGETDREIHGTPRTRTHTHTHTHTH
eukprot:GHVR01171073.1.p1 GENE.GHVR01171073.1~~GHVR01171073.1.p1  ORF type:complete len:473 (-),score=229.46 GHVR01171073.1:517-1935(-)